MAVNEPIDSRIRLAISRWPRDAPRGAVTTFCAEHGISRKSFYELRKRAKADGPAAVLEPRTRRPRTTPSKLTEEVKKQAIAVRAALEASGLDHGPISVHDKMHAMGLDLVPSTASLARIFREAGVARLEPRKKPRSAWRRFVYPAPNACWQLDATEYVLTGGRKCVIFQLIDDHSRYAVASRVAWGETATDAIAVFDAAVAAHGVPQRLLSDNGLALNPSRRGMVGQLVAHAAALGTEAITGKPYKPTTQGKNERFHQTLFRYLDQQPLAQSLAVWCLKTSVTLLSETGVARAGSRKKPHSAWRRYVSPAPNACWQVDVSEYVLAGGRRCVIFQLIDDRSRCDVASPAGSGKRSRPRSRCSTKGPGSWATARAPKRLIPAARPRTHPVAPSQQGSG